jgi:predicted kinase
METASLILIRGLPGAGKSSLAKVLSENGKYPVYSVDDYFTNEESGKYLFDHKLNHLAYASCEKKTRLAMQQGVDKIFVDNTFTLEWELKPYSEMAKEFSYRLYVLTVENRHGGQNIHGISSEQVEKMALKYKVKLIP